MQQLIFFHGGGSQEDYSADQKLVDSLKSNLGAEYEIHYPFLPNDGTPDMGRRQQIEKEILAKEDGVILVAHSFGASMLLACLSETKVKRKISGIFLISTPFWSGDEDWVQPYKLRSDFSKKLDEKVPLFFYHAVDDEEVPFLQLDVYKQNVPWATYRAISSGGHHIDNDLAIVAKDIKSL